MCGCNGGEIFREQSSESERDRRISQGCGSFPTQGLKIGGFFRVGFFRIIFFPAGEES